LSHIKAQPLAFAFIANGRRSLPPPTKAHAMSTHRELIPASPLVIVVDDDAAVRNSLRFSLEVEGFAVREYVSGAESLKDAGGFSEGCLVVDHNMPAMTGLDLVARLRERAITVPTILMACHATSWLRERAIRAGIRLVEKPPLGSVLLDRIRGTGSGAAIPGE
jgi:FixJ family two-component response regulator